MKVYDAILSRRSIRKFKQKQIKKDKLEKLVNAARLAPSAANLQPLEFIVINEKNICSKIFKTLSWAGYIKPKWTPKEHERPVAYITILIKDTKNQWTLRDVSFAASNIVLTAEEEGLGSCILCKIQREKIKEILKIPDEIKVDSVIALGEKAEHPVVEELIDSVKYWRDEKEILHVPKRKLQDIIHYNKY
jgi:nitroreductase